MADISRISRLLNGAMRGIDLPNNTLVMKSLKVTADGGSTSTELTKAILDKLILINTAADSDGTFDTRYLGISAKAADSELLDNHDSTYFAVASDLSTVSGKVDDLITLSGVAANAENLGSFTGTVIADDQNVKQAIQALETYSENSRSLIQNFEWENSVIDRLATPPVSPSSGDRYLVIATASGAWEGEENNIAEYNGASWDFTSPVLGMYVSVDDENDGLYLYGGSSWDKKYFEATTASTGLTKSGFDIQIANAAAANGISITSGAISAEVDDSTIEINVSEKIAVKVGGIANAQVAADAAIVESKLSLDYSTSSLNTAIGNRTYTEDNYVTDSESVTSSIDALDMAVKDNADAIAAISLCGSSESRVAGEAFDGTPAALYAVREAKGAETAGRVYKADKDATSSDNFNVIGLAMVSADKAAGDSMSVVYSGPITVTSHGFTQGAALFLGASGAIIEASSLSNVAYEAQKQIGVVRDANTIMIQIFQANIY